MAKPKVLIVEDNEMQQAKYREALKSFVIIFEALTIDKAEEFFAQHTNFDAIIFDACVPGNTPTTPPIIKKFKETFLGPMIATSSDLNYRTLLLHAGCNYESSKDNVPGFLLEVLKLTSQASVNTSKVSS